MQRFLIELSVLLFNALPFIPRLSYFNEAISLHKRFAFPPYE
jgi:hypothetical protein